MMFLAGQIREQVMAWAESKVSLDDRAVAFGWEDLTKLASSAWVMVAPPEAVFTPDNIIPGHGARYQVGWTVTLVISSGTNTYNPDEAHKVVTEIVGQLLGSLSDLELPDQTFWVDPGSLSVVTNWGESAGALRMALVLNISTIGEL